MPLFGSGLTLPVVVGAAVIDSINPCAFGVMIFLLSYMFKISHNRKKVIADGIGYVVGVYLTYLLLGIIMFLAIGGVQNALAKTSLVVYFYQIIGALIILAGLLELKDFFLEGKGPSLSIFPRFVEAIKNITYKMGDRMKDRFFVSMFIAIIMGFFVALVELPCTGAPYIAVITLLTQAGTPLPAALPLLAAYNIIFVLPLFGIMAIAYRGMATDTMKEWKEGHKLLMRAATGMLLVALGLFIFFFNLIFGGG